MVYLSHGQEDVFWTGLVVDELNQDPYYSSSSLDPVSIKQKYEELGGRGGRGGGGVSRGIGGENIGNGDVSGRVKPNGGDGVSDNGGGGISSGGSGGGDGGDSRVWVRRENIPGWRVDVRGKSTTPITNKAVIVHNVDWQLYRLQLGLSK